MANNKIYIKRTSNSGVTPNTTNASNTSYIGAGELAINMADSKLFTANTSGGLLELGSNLTNLSVTGTTKLVSISANGSVGASNQVLTSNGSTVYWSNGGVKYTLSSTPPANPQAGDVWIDDDDGTRYEYLVDNNSSQWVDFTSESAGTPVFIQNSAPTLSGSPYLWIQTGLAGNNVTFWIEDGQ